jgi:hypothetical protein
MNAVNLIPGDSRTRGEGLNVSPPTLALMGGLVVALIAAVLYVSAANTVATRKSQLAQITAGVAGWTAAANSYASFVHLAQQRTLQLADVRQLATSRFPWSNLLGQIGGVMPRAAALESLQASSTPSASGASVPSVQLSGCAASQSLVAQTMVQLRSITGVTAVTLSSSTDSRTASGGSASSSGSQSSGGCPFPVAFQLSLTFAPSATAATASSGSAATTAAPATTTATPVTAQ